MPRGRRFVLGSSAMMHGLPLQTRVMNSLIGHIDSTRIPRHVAIIMDGNGRWAKKQSKPRIWGHRAGVRAVRAVTEAAAELKIEYLTLYAFSTENWSRPRTEVSALMSLLVDTVFSELKTLMDNNIRLEAIGDLSVLPERTRGALRKGMEETASNSHMTLILALNYSARQESLAMVRAIAEEVARGDLGPQDITEEHIHRHLMTHAYPDPEFLIRTSGEQRISNFLLYQLAYTELYFTELYWPEFDKEAFFAALIDYQGRERRFGKTSDQLADAR